MINMLKIAVTVLGFSLLVTQGSVLLGAEGVTKDIPTTYSAMTDHQVRPEPALPQMGPAGTIITDPTFGSRILRVTDGNTRLNQRNFSFTTSGGSFMNCWNADTTIFWALGDGVIPFRFDAKTMTATRMGDTKNPSGGLVLPSSGPFSYRKPNIMYFTDGMSVREYDFNVNKSQPIFDASKLKPEWTTKIKRPYGYPPSISDDDSKIIIAFGGFQDEFPYIAWYDRTKSAFHILDTEESKIDGQPTSIKLGWGIHSAYVDRTGRFVVMGKGNGRKEGTEWLVWDALANDHGGDVAEIAKNWSGHEVAGFGCRINQAGYYGGNPAFYEQLYWLIRRLELGKLAETRELIAPSETPTPHPGATDSHLSWHNARPDVLTPVIVSVDHNSDTKLPWRTWDNEIIAVRTDGVEKTVWRFCHHRSISTSKNATFWDTSRGNVSQDGRWFIFTSNWGQSLGDDASPNHKGARRDVFMVDLMSAHGAK